MVSVAKIQELKRSLRLHFAVPLSRNLSAKVHQQLVHLESLCRRVKTVDVVESESSLVSKRSILVQTSWLPCLRVFPLMIVDSVHSSAFS